MKKILSVLLVLSMLVSLLTVFSLNTGAVGALENLSDIKETSAAFSEGRNSQMTVSVSTGRWASPVFSYLIDRGGDTFDALHVRDSSHPMQTEPGSGIYYMYHSYDIYVDTYNKSDFSLASDVKQIKMELQKFGGFFAGEDYNYIVFGADNGGEDNGAEVLRLVKYDKDFNKLSELKIGNCYTTVPFDAGSLRMDEHGDTLVIHTARERYTTPDGLNHQSQLTVIVDTEKMQVTNDLGVFQTNHVSHSFNQFVRFDGDTHVLVDHGDAYPRSIVLNKYNGKNYTTIDLFSIPGSIGANCTGVTVGGFEVSGSSYLVAINTVDQSKVTEYDSFNIYGLERDERDIVLLVSPKKSTSSSNVRTVKFTDYVGKGKLGSTPYLVKISDNKFMLMWQEFVYVDQSVKPNGVKYLLIDGIGNALTEVKHSESALLSSSCQPIVMDGKVTWYVNITADERRFYTVDLEAPSKAENPFNDVSEEDWYYDAVIFAHECGITSGVSEDRYAPKNDVTRGQFITMLCRAFDIKAMEGDNFSDCGNTYYTGYLAAVKQLGISKGVGENRFAPEDNVTREEMVTLIYNYLKWANRIDGDFSDSDFSDKGEISSWARAAVAYTVSCGYINGKPNNRFDPKGTATRAELAQIFYNMLG